jgi:RNA polymerase sigma factor (TIGR02999 family)
VTEPAAEQVTRVLAAMEGGHARAADELLPLVYDSLRRLAHKKLNQESPGLTLQATALVHEAYLRLLGHDAGFASRRHFFAAAAEAMRRILIDRARRHGRVRHGGDRQRVPLGDVEIECELKPDELVALDGVLARLAETDPRAYDIVTLRFFGGLSIEQVAELLEISVSTANREWRAARLWLYERITNDEATRER